MRTSICTYTWYRLSCIKLCRFLLTYLGDRWEAPMRMRASSTCLPLSAASKNACSMERVVSCNAASAFRARRWASEGKNKRRRRQRRSRYTCRGLAIDFVLGEKHADRTTVKPSCALSANVSNQGIPTIDINMNSISLDFLFRKGRLFCNQKPSANATGLF